MNIHKVCNLKYVFTLLLLCSFFLRAEANEDYIDEIDLFDDVATITSATRLKQKVTDAPVSVTIIDKQMIEASGATELHELFRLVPGFFSYSVWGNQFGVTNHFQPRDVGIRVEVQINGRSIYDPLFTTVDWSSLGVDINDVDHIEVVRGSSATTYGSNAFLGAINIITKDVITRPKASIRTAIGNIGRKNLTINHSGNLNDIDYGLSFVSRSNTGFPALENSNAIRDQSHDDRDSINLSLQGNYVPNIDNEIKFEIGLGENKFELPTGDDIRGYSNRKHSTNYQKIEWISKSRGIENTVQFYHNYLNLEDDLTLGLLSTALNVSPEAIPSIFPGQQDQVIDFGPNSISERYDLEFVHRNTSNKSLGYVFGAGVRRDKVNSHTLIGIGDRSEKRSRVFGNIDWHINEKINTNLGLLVEHSDLSGTINSPRLAVNFHPSKHHTIRGSITSGRRATSVTLQNLNTGIRFPDGTLIDTETIRSDDLSKEKITAYEVGYIADFPKIKSKLDFRLFREEMDDFVKLQIQPFDDLNGRVRVYNNAIKDLITQGAEVQFSHTFLNQPDLSLRLAYAYIDTDGFVARDTIQGEVIESSAVPRHSGTMMINKKLPNQFDFSSIWQYQSDYQNRGVAIKRVDFRLGKKLKFEKSKGKLDLVVQNAFNKYNDFARRNVMKTRAYINMKLDF